MTVQELSEELRRKREAAGLDIAEIARKMNVSKSILLALENSMQGTNVHLAYLRGFLKSYAATVGVDPTQALAVFDENFVFEDTSKILLVGKPIHGATRFHFWSFLGKALLVLAIIGAAFGAYWMFVEGKSFYDNIKSSADVTVENVENKLEVLSENTKDASTADAEKNVIEVVVPEKSTQKVAPFIEQTTEQKPDTVSTETANTVATKIEQIELVKEIQETPDPEKIVSDENSLLVTSDDSADVVASDEVAEPVEEDLRENTAIALAPDVSIESPAILTPEPVESVEAVEPLPFDATYERVWEQRSTRGASDLLAVGTRVSTPHADAAGKMVTGSGADTVSFTAQADCWIATSWDNSSHQSLLLRAGQQYTIHFSTLLYVKVGNADAVDVLFNEKACAVTAGEGGRPILLYFAVKK